MIELKGVTKGFNIGNKFKFVLRTTNLKISSSECFALLGRNGAGKSTFLKMLSGEIRPDSGDIISKKKISWPIGFAGSFHSDLTGLQNTRFIARAYGVDTKALERYVEDFSELGDQLKMPYRTYSSGMRSKLAFGVSMGINFDFYLIDEVTSVGDASFRKKSKELLKFKLKSAGAIVVSHSMPIIRELCTAALVLDDGRLTYFDDLEQAIIVHNNNMGV